MDERGTCESVIRRPARSEDGPFLLRLFRESQQELLQALGSAAEPLIVMQYRGRSMSYGKQYPLAEDFILLDEDEEAVGRVLLDRSSKCWRIIDFALLQAHQGRGRGQNLLTEIQQGAAQAGAEIGLQVRPGNPAQRLYLRSGFLPVSETLAGVEMRWHSDGQHNSEPANQASETN